MRDRGYPLYHSELEHESCGVGAVVDLSGKRTHRTVNELVGRSDLLKMKPDAAMDLSDLIGFPKYVFPAGGEA